MFQDESAILWENVQANLHLWNQRNLHSKVKIYVDKDNISFEERASLRDKCLPNTYQD